jgi:hypothetical protein
MQPYKINEVLRSLSASLSRAWFSLSVVVKAIAIVPSALGVLLLTSCYNLEKNDVYRSAKLTGYQAHSGRVEISSRLAHELLSSLDRAGIEDIDQIPGMRNLKAQKIVCQRHLGPKVEPHCWIGLYNQQVLVPAVGDQEALYKLLLKIGGLTLPAEPDTITVSAEDIVCTQGPNQNEAQSEHPICYASVNRPQSYNIGGS